MILFISFSSSTHTYKYIEGNQLFNLPFLHLNYQYESKKTLRFIRNYSDFYMG
jgi:hypothetical protein